MSGIRKLSSLLAITVALASLTAGCEGTSSIEEISTIPMALYENTEHGFSIEYPEGWTEDVLRSGAYFSIEFSDSEGLLVADVSLQYGTEDFILTDLVSEGKAYMEAMPQFELASEGNVTIGEGISSYEMVGEGDLGTGKVEKFRYVVLVRGKQSFWIGVRVEPDEFVQQEQTVDAIVDSFKLLPTYTFELPTLAAGTCTNAEYGFSISYPEGWMESPAGSSGEIVSLATAEGMSGVSIRVSTVGEGTTLAQFIPQFSQDFSQHWSDYELFSEGEITLDNGTPAYEIVFSGTTEGYTLKGKYVIVIQETNAFFIMGYGVFGSFEQDESAIDEVLHSFHLE